MHIVCECLDIVGVERNTPLYMLPGETHRQERYNLHEGIVWLALEPNDVRILGNL